MECVAGMPEKSSRGMPEKSSMGMPEKSSRGMPEPEKKKNNAGPNGSPKSLGLYIHIPFCLHKCPYCDFCSTDFHDTKLRKRYVDALCKEIAYYGDRYRDTTCVTSVFFGGGTPSLLEVEELRQITDRLGNSFHVESEAEISIECNPATLDGKKLMAYREMGINRLSIGVQSFDNGVLATLGRIHNADEAKEAYEAAVKAGFGNINIDLMFGVPGQTFETWTETVRTALSVEPQHISLYSLEFMEGTLFRRWRDEGKMVETTAEDDRLMYEHALKMMAERGYMQYEISNVARDKDLRCRHNLRYWELEDYLGLGASAHSFMRNVRYSNVSDVAGYINAMERQDASEDLFIGASDAHGTGACASDAHGAEACATDAYGADACGTGACATGANGADACGTEAYGTGAIDFYHKNSYMDNVSEYMFTGLRKNEGVFSGEFRKRFEKDIWDLYDEEAYREFSKFVDGGFAVEDEKGIRLTLKGMNISNKIMSIFV